MKTLADHFKRLVSICGNNASELSRRSGVPIPTITRAANGDGGVDGNSVMKVCRALKLSDKETRDILISANIFRTKGDEKSFWAIVAKEAERFDELFPDAENDSLSAHGRTKIPIYAHATGGCGSEGFSLGEKIDEIDAPVPLGKDVFGILIKGDSMDGPPSRIADGEYVLFTTPNGESVDGKIALVCVEGWTACAIKRIRVDPSGVLQLCSDNKDFKPIQVDPNEKQVVFKGIFAGSWKDPKRFGR